MTAYCKRIQGGRIGIWCGFDYKDWAKSIPSARWDPGLKCWHVDSTFHDEAMEMCNAINDGRQWTFGYRQRQQRKTTTSGSLGDSFEQVLRKVPQPLRERLYKASSKVLHPDVGGDLASMQALTEAWERVR